MKVIGVVLLSMVLFVFYISVFPWLLLYLGISLTPNPPVPEITYGEFPFRLEYEIDGEIIVVENAVICEYDGVGSDEGRGKFRKWKSYLSDSGEENVLLITDSTRKIYCYIGNAEYYMDDETYPEKSPLTPRIYSVKLDSMDKSILSQDELCAKYNIKLISWEFANPIENEFISN